jgi:hypothetical protein
MHASAGNPNELGGHVDLFSICIKGAEQTHFISSRIGLQLLKCCFRYKERPLHGPVTATAPVAKASARH